MGTTTAERKLIEILPSLKYETTKGYQRDDSTLIEATKRKRHTKKSQGCVERLFGDYSTPERDYSETIESQKETRKRL